MRKTKKEKKVRAVPIGIGILVFIFAFVCGVVSDVLGSDFHSRLFQYAPEYWSTASSISICLLCSRIRWISHAYSPRGLQASSSSLFCP